MRIFRNLALGIFVALVSCGVSVNAAETIDMENLPLNETVTLTSGTKIRRLVAGSGVIPGPDVDLLLHYTLKINGVETDNSRTRIIPNPFQVTLGKTPIVPGFSAALQGMRVGEVREAIVPPEQGYGADGSRALGIPPGVDLVFNIELVGTRKRKPE